jgi:hypothetical protein
VEGVSLSCALQQNMWGLSAVCRSTCSQATARRTMPHKPFTEAQSWRNRANSTRARGDQINDGRMRGIATIIANTYERVAEQIEQRSGSRLEIWSARVASKLAVAQAVAPPSSIPRVQCPQCGAIMRLSQIAPDADGSHKETMIFDCRCGFEYRQSGRVRD